MAVKSDFGNQILVTDKNGVTFDLNKNYSAAIDAAKAAGQDTTQLERERRAKIDSAAYGGKEKTGVNNASSVGSSYKSNSTVKNRTSTSDPIVEQVVVDPNAELLAQIDALKSQVNNQNTALQEYMNGQYNKFEDFMDSMGYDKLSEQTQNYIKTAVDQAVKGYQGQIENVNQDTEELARQAYINKMMGEKNLDQKLAAGGYSGGLADSQRIGLQANYENNLAALEQQRLDTVKELEKAIENAKLTGDMQAAQELSGYLSQIQGQWSNYLQNQQALMTQNYWNQVGFDNENYWNKLNFDNANYWNQQSANTQSQNAARNWALTLIENGTMPDESTLTNAGISQTEASSLLQQVLAAQKRANAQAVKEPTYTAEQARVALTSLAAGSNDPTARSIVESYYKLPYETVILGFDTGEGKPNPAELGNSGLTLNDIDESEITNESSENGVMLARTNGAPMFVPWENLESYMKSGTAYIGDNGNGKYTLVYNG